MPKNSKTMISAIAILFALQAYSQESEKKDEDSDGKTEYKYNSVGISNTNSKLKKTTTTKFNGFAGPGLGGTPPSGGSYGFGGGGTAPSQGTGGTNSGDATVSGPMQTLPSGSSGGSGMGYPGMGGGYGYFVPMESKFVSETSKNTIGIEAKSYKFSMPDGNGVMKETSLNVGVSYTKSQLLAYSQYLPQNGGSGAQPPVCMNPYGPNASIYNTKAFGASGGVSMIQGYKIGNHVFAFAMGGVTAQGNYEISKQVSSIQSPGMGMIGQPSAWGGDTYVYLGTVGEIGTGITSDKGTVTLSGTVNPGLNMANQPMGVMTPPGQITAGPKVRAMNDQGQITAYTNFGKTGNGPNTQHPSFYQQQNIVNFGCEVLVKVGNSPVSIGGSVVGEKRTSEVNNQFVSSDTKTKTMTGNVKAVWLIGSGKKKSKKTVTGTDLGGQ